MSTATVTYQAAAASDRGRKRPANEDAFGFSVEHGVYVVCDGMGGAAAGEIASTLAVDEFMHRMTGKNAKPSREAAETAVLASNAAIYTRSHRNAKLSGMGTTLVSLVVEASQAWILNVGDSRCYRLHEDTFEQITLDHSLVEEQVRMGRLTSEEAARSPLRNVITRALGTQPHVTTDVFELEAVPGDLFLLCSDGLTRELCDDQLAQMLRSSHELDVLCEDLVNAANLSGGRDNITCVVVRVAA